MQVPPVSRKVSSTSSRSKPKAPTQPPPDHSKEAPKPSSPPPPSPLFTNLPFRICESRPTVFSSSASSFSRLRRRASFISDDEELNLKSDAVNYVPEPPQVVIAPPKPVRRKPPNLITDSITSPPVKVPVFRSSGGGEGSFVKLNLNGKRGKKFPSKYKGLSKYTITHSEGRRDTKRKKRKVTANWADVAEEP